MRVRSRSGDLLTSSKCAGCHVRSGGGGFQASPEIELGFGVEDDRDFLKMSFLWLMQSSAASSTTGLPMARS